MNTNKFEGAIRSAGYTEGQLAGLLHMTANTFSKKKKTGTFTLAQVEQICEIIGISTPGDKCDIFLPLKFQ